jgi:hypothetical protein
VETYCVLNWGKGSPKVQTCAYAAGAQKDDQNKEVKIYFQCDDKDE